MIRSAGTRGAVKDKVKVQVTVVSRLFRSTDGKSPERTVMLQMWIATITKYELPQ